MSRTREGVDEFSAYIEEETGRGWRKLRRMLNGYEFLIYGSKTDDYIKAYLAGGVDFALNIMSDRLDIKLGDSPLRPLTDIDESVLLARLLDYGMRGEGHMRKALHTRAAQNKYHPVKLYLDGLLWDGEKHFDALMDHLSVSSEGAAVFWRKFLIGSIAKALAGEQNYMLILLGAQGKGKSRLVRWLCPLPQLFHEGPISPDNKDDQIKLLETWLWEVAELDSTTKRAERSALKHFITMRNVGVRVPYGRYAINKTAVASMIGTINEDGTGFLNDPTGDRRFVVVHLDDIDWNYTEIDRDQLWAELYAAYCDGETWELTPHEKEIQSEINKQHTISTPVEEMLLQYFAMDRTETGRFMATMDILEQLEGMGLKGDQYKNKMELTAVLTKYGLPRTQRRVDGKRIRGFEGIWFDKAKIGDVHI